MRITKVRIYSRPGYFRQIREKVRRLMESHIYHDGKSLKEFEIIANDIVHDINDMPYDVIVDIKSVIRTYMSTQSW